MPIEDSKLYRLFVDLSDEVWEEVGGWKGVAKSTVGTQLVRAIDSVAANLVEGDGRYGAGEGVHFFIIARASARESAYWLRRAAKRNLLPLPTAAGFLERIDHATRGLNNLISYRRSRGPLMTKEASASYSASTPQDPVEHRTPNTEHPSAPNYGALTDLQLNFASPPAEHRTPNTEHPAPTRAPKTELASPSFTEDPQ
jgi:four helix bundle protein